MLPTLRISIPAEQALSTLDAAARRGKLGGFAHGTGGILFTVRDFGGPFESILEARLTNGTVHFTTRLRTGLAWVYFFILVLSVWPGVWLTDSMLRTYFTGYDYKTWMWYLPMTAPFVPWGMWATIKKSRAKALADVGEILESIAKLLGGRLEGGSLPLPTPAPAQTVPQPVEST